MSIELTQAETNTASIDSMLATEIKPRPLSYSLNDYHHAGVPGSVLHAQWQDKPHRLLYDLIAAVAYYSGKQPATGEPVGEVFYAADGGDDETGAGYNMTPCVRFIGKAPEAGTKLYTTPQPAQATQAEVTDEREAFEQWYAALPNNGRKAGLTLLDAWQARAILALRHAAVPMTREQVFASDELMAINGSLLGLSMCDLMQVIRIIEAHHGITAQAKKEGV